MTFNIPEVLAGLNIHTIRERGDEILCHCPMHKARTGKDDQNPSWWINNQTGAHICFSCGFKGNVFSLVGEVKELYVGDAVDYDAVKTWLANIEEVSIEELSERLKNLPNYVSAVDQTIPMSEARLALFTPPPAWALEKRRITEEAAAKYELLWGPDNTWILPIRDPNDFTLWGWQEKQEGTRKFNNYPVGVKKSKTLFAAHEQTPEMTLLVESPLDAARIASTGIQGAVASFGAIVSDAQVKLLRYSDIVVAAFDNPTIDEAGRKACEAMIVSARKYGMTLKFFNYNGSFAKDVGDMTDEEVKYGIETAKDMIYGAGAYIS
jgi:DNA primase